MSKRLLIVKNVFSGIISRVLLLVLGFLVPRVVITTYGSDVNGLLGTVTQIFSYMALLEAGIGQATLNALYKPVANGDKEKISLVMSSSKAYFRRATLIYMGCFCVLSFAFPFVINTNLDYVTVFLIVLFEGASEIVSFLYIQCRNELLYAEGKSYVAVSTDTVIKILNYFAKIILALCGVNIVVVQMSFFGLNLLKYLFYRMYFVKDYSWLDFTKTPDKSVLKERNSFVLTELSWTVFMSTDMIVLSIFCDTKLASVYSVYNLVFMNVSNILGAVFSGISYLLGIEYCKNIDRYKKLHDMYNIIFMSAITILMSVSYIMIEPFIKLYTEGVSDVNYSYHGLAMMFSLIQLISWSRYVNGNLTGIAGYAKVMSKVSMVEAMINIIVSIILVNKLGILGVVIGTVVALPLKYFTSCYIVDKKILHRTSWKTHFIVGLNMLLFFGVTYVCKYIDIRITGYGDFLWSSMKVLIEVGGVIAVINFIAHMKTIIHFSREFRVR